MATATPTPPAKKATGTGPEVLIEVRERLLADPSHSDAAVSATSMSLYLVEHPEVRVAEVKDYPEWARQFEIIKEAGRG